MVVVDDDLILFWLTPRSEPFRAACLYFTLETQSLRGRRPNKLAPRWLRPFFLHRWVGEAIAARLATNPQTMDYRCGQASEPCWSPDAWTASLGRALRLASEARLLWLFSVEVERLLRIAQEHPGLVGDDDWTGAALGASEHIARVYAELKRRFKAMRARALLAEELRRFMACCCI